MFISKISNLATKLENKFAEQRDKLADFLHDKIIQLFLFCRSLCSYFAKNIISTSKKFLSARNSI